MDGKRSRWRQQRNGLPQGSVLAPLLFNVYTNDQPQHHNTRRFIYADDLCIATHGEKFKDVEDTLTEALSLMEIYYKQWYLKANPSKTQVTSFHLKNRRANYKIKVSWCGEILEHHTNPIYLGVTLDRALTFKKHIENLKKKVSARNNILKILANSKWGANPQTLRTTALALCYSAAEYCAPVWCRSAHAHKVDAELNEACRTITGCLRPTPINKLHTLAGIAPPAIRREALENAEKRKRTIDPRHPLHQHTEVAARLKSRKSFNTVQPH